MAEGLAGLAQGLAQGTTYLNTAVSNRMQTEAQNKATDTRAALDRESLAAQKEEALANREFRKLAFERQKDIDDRTYNLEAGLAEVKKTVELGMLRNQDRSVTVAENQQETSAEMAKKASDRDDKRLGLEVIKTEEGIRQGDEELDIRRAENKARAAQVQAQFDAENNFRRMEYLLKVKQLFADNLEASRNTDFLIKEHSDKMQWFNQQNIGNTLLTIDTAPGIDPVTKEQLKRGMLRTMVLTGAIHEDVVASTNSPETLAGSVQALKGFNETATLATKEFEKAIGEGKNEFAAYVEYVSRLEIAANETQRLLRPNSPRRIRSEDVDGVVDELLKSYSGNKSAGSSKAGTSAEPKRLKTTEVEGPKGLQFLKAKGAE